MGSISSSQLMVSHILFVALIFCANDPEQIHNLKCVLLCFEAIFRLVLKFGKSELMPVGTVPEVAALAQIPVWGCLWLLDSNLGRS